MAYFVRTRRLDVSRLATGPQESLDVVHAILTAAAQQVLDKLSRVERSYTAGRSHLAEVARWAAAARRAAHTLRVSAITCAEQVEEASRRAAAAADAAATDGGDAGSKPGGRHDVFDLNMLRDAHSKVREAVPDKFQDVLTDLRTLLAYTEKYCLSFYCLEQEEDAGLDYPTARDYEKKRQAAASEVRERIQTIIRLGAKLRGGKEKFLLSDLSGASIELARRADAQHAPFLLAVPDACEHIRACCACIKSWVDEDANYVVYVKNDIAELEGRREEALRALRDGQDKYHTLGFRLKQAASDVSRLEEELAALADKEDELQLQEELAVSDSNDVQTAIESKEYQRDALLKNAAAMQPELLYEKYSELCEELRELRQRLPTAKRQLLNARYKLSWIAEKKEEMAFYQKRLAAVQKDMDAIEQRRQEEDVEYQHLVKVLEKARQIHLFKSTPDSVTKIYHEQPVEVNNARLPGHRGPKDPFERACMVVARHVGSGWASLYRALPFHPPRGRHTVDADVKHFSSLGGRVPIDEVATRALHRWRRFHVRAKLDDLLAALAAVRRSDVAALVDAELHPPVIEEPEDTTDYSYVEPELVPFVKEVEKFDRLAALGRLPLEDEGVKFRRLQAEGKIPMRPEVERLLRMQTMAKIRVK